MIEKPMTSEAELEEIAVEFLAEQGEAAHRDNCEHQLDRFSDAELADALVTEYGGRLGKLDFGRLVDAFGRLRLE